MSVMVYYVGVIPHILNKILGSQRKVLRIITSLGFRDVVRNEFIKVGILTVPYM